MQRLKQKKKNGKQPKTEEPETRTPSLHHHHPPHQKKKERKDVDVSLSSSSRLPTVSFSFVAKLSQRSPKNENVKLTLTGWEFSFFLRARFPNTTPQ